MPTAAEAPRRGAGQRRACCCTTTASTPDDAVAYAERWALLPPARAEKVVQFQTDPTWRAYIFCYVEGLPLCRSFIAGDPTRFERLLTEQLTPDQLDGATRSSTVPSAAPTNRRPASRYDRPPIVDVVMPARDEAATVAANVRAALGCRYVRDVIVVDDGSSDDTASVAERAGAVVVRRPGSTGSKAHTMADGVRASDADAFLFVDADCTGLAARHLDDVCQPFVDGVVEMSIGFFDYGPFWNPWVRVWPPLSGERIVPRWLWDDIPREKLAGYTIEVRIDEAVARRRLRTAVRTMRGVQHRTKRHKRGLLEGYRLTWRMYRELVRVMRPLGDVPWRAYAWYLRGRRSLPPAGGA